MTLVLVVYALVLVVAALTLCVVYLARYGCQITPLGYLFAAWQRAVLVAAEFDRRAKVRGPRAGVGGESK